MPLLHLEQGKGKQNRLDLTADPALCMRRENKVDAARLRVPIHSASMTSPVEYAQRISGYGATRTNQAIKQLTTTREELAASARPYLLIGFFSL